jgi:uncharacterized protein (TIGR02266 family)
MESPETSLDSSLLMAGKKKVLAAITKQEVLDALEPLLSRSSVGVDRVASGEAGLVLASATPYDLILAQIPLLDMSAAMLVTSLRQPSCPCRNSRLLFLASGHQQPATEAYSDNLVGSVTLSTSTREFRQAVATALGIALRVSSRLLVSLQVALDRPPTPTTRVYQSENVSRTGMLLRTGHPLPVGTEFLFDFALPDSDTSFKGSGVVVRHTEPGAERVYGMGIQFLDLDEDVGQLLDLFVRTEKTHVAPNPPRARVQTSA